MWGNCCSQDLVGSLPKKLIQPQPAFNTGAKPGVLWERDPIEEVASKLLEQFGSADLACIVDRLLEKKPQVRRLIKLDLPFNQHPEVQVGTHGDTASLERTLEIARDKSGGKVDCRSEPLAGPLKEEPLSELKPQDVKSNECASLGGSLHGTIATRSASPNHAANDVSGDNHAANGVSGASQEQIGTSVEISILQFSTAIYYVREDEGEISIDVARLGSPSGECSVVFTSVDASAKAGIKYQHTSGTLHFAEGETLKQILIKITQDEIWDATLEFKIVLSDAKGAQLGRYLWTCRVRIIDDDAFPTNKFKEAVLKQDFESIPLVMLMLEYLRMNFTNPIIKRGGMFMIIADGIQNVYSVFRLFLLIYLVDYTLNLEYDPDQLFVPGNRSTCMLIVVLLLVVPYVFFHWIEIQSRYWKVGGTARRTLQANLLRKYLNYEETVRAALKQSDVMIAMTRDTTELVHHGFLHFFRIIQSGGKLLLLLMFQISLVRRDMVSLGIVLTPNIILPTVMFTFLAIRKKKTTIAKSREYTLQSALLAHVDQTVDNARLVIDYHRRPIMVDKMSQRVDEFNEAEISYSVIMVTNRLLAPWSSILITAAFIMIGGLWVLDGKMLIGEFLTHCGVFYELGELWRHIYDDLLVMYSALPALEHITRYLNLPTDVEKRRILNRQQRERGLEKHLAARRSLSQMTVADAPVDGADSRSSDLAAGTGGQVFAADMMMISMENVNFFYTPSLNQRLSILPGCNMKPGGADLNCCTFEVPQGTLVAVVGHRGEGKTTLLKILAGVLLADTGRVFLPPQLRVFHIGQEPSFIDGTLMENLTFGCNEGDSDAHLDRVIAICKRLGVSEAVLAYIRAGSVKKWKDILSHTECMLLHIARGLVANPEVLAIHKPTLVFDDVHAQHVFGALRAHVDEKGLEQDPNQRVNRRPRTCFCTFSRLSGVAIADRVFLCAKTGTRELSKDLTCLSQIADDLDLLQ